MKARLIVPKSNNERKILLSQVNSEIESREEATMRKAIELFEGKIATIKEEITELEEERALLLSMFTDKRNMTINAIDILPADPGRRKALLASIQEAIHNAAQTRMVTN